MQVRVFAIPMDGDSDAIEELNAFLRGQKVLSVEKVAVVDHGRHYWSLCVEYLPRRGADTLAAGGRASTASTRVDYREIFGKDEFDRCSKLRALRKQLSEAEGVPVYAILNNAQIAELARTVPQTKTSLAALEGLGPAKLDRYGEPLLKLLQSMPGLAAAVATTPPTEAPWASEAPSVSEAAEPGPANNAPVASGR